MDTEHTEIKELVLFKRLDAKAPSGAKLLELGATGYEPKSLLLDGCATKVDFGVTQTLHAVEGRSPSPLDMPPWGRAHRGGDFPPTLSPSRPAPFAHAAVRPGPFSRPTRRTLRWPWGKQGTPCNCTGAPRR